MQQRVGWHVMTNGNKPSFDRQPLGRPRCATSTSPSPDALPSRGIFRYHRQTL